MMANLRTLPISERIQLVENLWDSIVVDQVALPITKEQKNELDRRLDAYELDGIKGRVVAEVIADIRKRL